MDLLDHLESEAIHLIREAVADAERPILLHSLGKDSCALAHLVGKAFAPARPPLGMLHVDTTWKFAEMYRFRDGLSERTGMELLVHTNPEARAAGINPWDHGSATHTDRWKTDGLRQAIDLHGFDVLIGGARRDEERSRAKERMVSVRTAQHRWDPRRQRPELWDRYNMRRGPGETLRVFPLSNWTELDVWRYIRREGIAITGLYLARPRPVVRRGTTWITVDDHRFRLEPTDVVEERLIRFRTLGCYPLTGGVDSDATTLDAVIAELETTSQSERIGRVIDHDGPDAMENRKQEGYF